MALPMMADLTWRCIHIKSGSSGTLGFWPWVTRHQQVVCPGAWVSVKPALCGIVPIVFMMWGQNSSHMFWADLEQLVHFSSNSSRQLPSKLFGLMVQPLLLARPAMAITLNQRWTLFAISNFSFVYPWVFTFMKRFIRNCHVPVGSRATSNSQSKKMHSSILRRRLKM